MLVLSVAIASTSIYFGNQWTKEIEVVEASMPKQRQDLSKNQTLLQSIQQSLKPDAISDKRLDVVMAETLLHINTFAQQNSLSITQIGSGDQTLKDLNNVDSLQKQVSDSQLKAIQLNVTFSYKSYEGMRAFFDSFKNMPVAITKLKITDNIVDTSLVLYGK